MTAENTITQLRDRLLAQTERVQNLVRTHADTDHSLLWPILAEPKRAPNTPREPRLAIDPECIEGPHIHKATKACFRGYKGRILQRFDGAPCDRPADTRLALCNRFRRVAFS